MAQCTRCFGEGTVPHLPGIRLPCPNNCNNGQVPDPAPPTNGGNSR